MLTPGSRCSRNSSPRRRAEFAVRGAHQASGRRQRWIRWCSRLRPTAPGCPTDHADPSRFADPLRPPTVCFDYGRRSATYPPPVANNKRGAGSTEFIGTWRITEMDMWETEAFDGPSQARFFFAGDGLGSLRFLGVEGEMDCRLEIAAACRSSSSPGPGATRRTASSGVGGLL